MYVSVGMDSGQTLGVQPVISAKEMSDPEVDHLGIMAYAAWFEHLVNDQPISQFVSNLSMIWVRQ